MRQALRSLANEDHFIELPDFIRLALYHPTLGYYRQRRQRIGRNPQTDFYTSASFKSVFGEIVLEAAVSLLDSFGFSPSQTDWVEIGADADRGLLSSAQTPFQSKRHIGFGDKLELEGQLVVFSNELFDAQPFRQLRFESGCWREYGIALEEEALSWRPRENLSEEAHSWLPQLPNSTSESYIVDLPCGSNSLLQEIAASNWNGVFIAFDYGKSWKALIEETPQGTARGYNAHQLVEDILASPGQQDITLHICWDNLESGLRENAFQSIHLQSQESFIAHHAPEFLKKAFDPTLSPLDPLRSQLKELMHPSLMGQKFQALTAHRA